jgi:hypothetical protein
MKDIRLSLIFLLVVLISISLTILPVVAQQNIPGFTTDPQTMDFTICYPDGDVMQVLTLKNDNDFPIDWLALETNIPHWSGLPLDFYSGTIAPHDQTQIQVKISAKTFTHIPPVLPVGDYSGTVEVQQFATVQGQGVFGYTIVPVNYHIVNCGNTPEFPSSALPIIMIIGFLGSVMLIQRTRDH